MMATLPSHSTSSDAGSWEMVGEGDSCRFSECDHGMPEAEDQESAVLDGSVNGETPGPASPDDLPRSEVPRPKSDGDHSPNPTESSPATFVMRSAPSGDDSLYKDIYNDEE